MSSPRAPHFFAAALLLALSAACAKGNSTPPPADAGSDGGTDAGVVCTATADYGIVDAGPSQYANYSAPPDAGLGDSYQYQGQLNLDAKFDYIDMELYAGYGAFGAAGGPIKTGTFTLGGSDLQYQTCGICVLLFTDTDPITLNSTDSYMATGGTVTINSLAPTFSGTFTGLTFTHVDINMTTFESTPVGDGCNAQIDSMPFSATTSDAGSGS